MLFFINYLPVEKSNFELLNVKVTLNILYDNSVIKFFFFLFQCLKWPRYYQKSRKYAFLVLLQKFIRCGM